MGDIVYQSLVRVERIHGTLRRAYLPASSAPVHYGVHAEIADHYGVPRGTEDEHTTTLDHIVAAAAG